MANYPASLDTSSNLPTTFVDATAQAVVHAAVHDLEDGAIAAVEAKLGVGASLPTTIGQVLTVTGVGSTAYQTAAGAPIIQDEGSGLGNAGTLNFIGAGVVATVTGGVATITVAGGSSTATVPFKSMFGPMNLLLLPTAEQLTLNAIAGLYDQTTTIAALPEASAIGVSLAAQLTGLVNGQTVRLTPAIYRETQPTISALNVKIIANYDVSIRGSNVFVAWSTAPAPNASNGIVSTVLAVPAFTVETDNGQFPGGVRTVQSGPEQVFVDGIMYNRMAAGTVLTAGQWCFVNDSTDRRPIVYLAGGAAGHKIEVTVRQGWVNTQGTGLTVDGVDFRHSASYANTTGGIENHSFANLIVQNCSLGFAHGMASAWGGSSGGKALNNVFHNNGTIGIDTNNETGFVCAGNLFFNNGGTNRRFGGALDGDGYDRTWGSGGIKCVGAKNVITGNFAWNNGFSCYWYDEHSSVGGITNNMAWDSGGFFIHYEISSYYSIHGNVLFQTNSSRYYSDTGLIGIHISTSRDGDIGPDPRQGQLPNVIMRLPIGIKVQWNEARAAADGAMPASWKVAGQETVRNEVHNNVIISRIGGSIRDEPLHFTDDSSGSRIALVGNGNAAYENAYGFTNYTESGTGTVAWSDNFEWFCSKTGLPSQDGSGYWLNLANLNASQFGKGPDRYGVDRPSRQLSWGEVVDYLDRYALPMGN